MKTILSRLRCCLAVAKAEALQLVRDRFTLSLLLTVPIIQIILFGYTVNLNPKNLPVAIAGPDASVIRPFVERTGYFRIVGDQLASGEAIQQVRAKQALIAIESTRTSQNQPTLHLVVDASDPAAVRPALMALQIAVWQNLSAANAVVEVDWLYNEAAQGAWAIVPGLIGVIVMISTLLLAALSLVRERERGTWESLLSTPLTSMEALTGKLAPLLGFALVQTVIVLFLSQFLFAVPLRGSLPALLCAALVFSLAHLLIGFVISACVSTQLQAIQGAVFFYLPCMLLSGFMFPFQGMPRWAQLIGETLPLTHFVRIARGVMLRGEGAFATAVEMAPVMLLIVLLLVIAHWSYRLRLQ
jgi:ABC-2 type transport system permease protein